MFEVGRDYSLKQIVSYGGEWTDESSVWKIEKAEGTLIEVSSQHSPNLIINTSSQHFVSAELLEDRAGNERRAAIFLPPKEPS